VLIISGGIGPADQLAVVRSSDEGVSMASDGDWINLPVGYNIVDHVNVSPSPSDLACSLWETTLTLWCPSRLIWLSNIPTWSSMTTTRLGTSQTVWTSTCILSIDPEFWPLRLPISARWYVCAGKAAVSFVKLTVAKDVGPNHRKGRDCSPVAVDIPCGRKPWRHLEV
jgi:hypothetical protein